MKKFFKINSQHENMSKLLYINHLIRYIYSHFKKWELRSYAKLQCYPQNEFDRYDVFFGMIIYRLYMMNNIQYET